MITLLENIAISGKIFTFLNSLLLKNPRHIMRRKWFWMLFNYFYFVNKYRNYVYRPFVVIANSEFTNIYHSPLAVRHSYISLFSETYSLYKRPRKKKLSEEKTSIIQSCFRNILEIWMLCPHHIINGIYMLFCLYYWKSSLDE